MGARDKEETPEEFERQEHKETEVEDRRRAKDRRARDRRARDEWEDKDKEEEGEDEEPDFEKTDVEEVDDQLSNLGSHAQDRHRADDRRDGMDRKGGKDRKGAKDSAMKPITQDSVNRMIEEARLQERRRAKAANEAREFIRPYVGQVALALDSAEQILRAGARALDIENAEKVHVDALKPLIKVYGQRRHTSGEHEASDLVMDSSSDDGTATFNEMFGADRIKTV